MSGQVELKTGCHYWYRHKAELIWRICYVGEDHDDNQWLHPIGIPPMLATDFDLGWYDWILIPAPIDTAEGGCAVSKNANDAYPVSCPFDHIKILENRLAALKTEVAALREYRDLGHGIVRTGRDRYPRTCAALEKVDAEKDGEPYDTLLSEMRKMEDELVQLTAKVAALREYRDLWDCVEAEGVDFSKEDGRWGFLSVGGNFVTADSPTNAVRKYISTTESKL